VPEQTSANYVELAADVVSAYVSNNPVPTSELPSLIAAVHASLQFVAEGPKEQPKVPLVPAVSIKKSVQPDYIVCLEDGKKWRQVVHSGRPARRSPSTTRATIQGCCHAIVLSSATFAFGCTFNSERTASRASSRGPECARAEIMRRRDGVKFGCCVTFRCAHSIAWSKRRDQRGRRTKRSP
jgi:ROS/MUCR transcriptional regulator protein